MFQKSIGTSHVRELEFMQYCQLYFLHVLLPLRAHPRILCHIFFVVFFTFYLGSFTKLSFCHSSS